MRSPVEFIFTGCVFAVAGYGIGIGLEQLAYTSNPTPLSNLPKKLGSRRAAAWLQLFINVVILYIFECVTPSWAGALTLTEGMMFPAVLFGVQSQMFAALSLPPTKEGGSLGGGLEKLA